VIADGRRFRPAICVTVVSGFLLGSSPLALGDDPKDKKDSVELLTKIRSRLGDQPGGAIHRVTRPEKTGGHCEVQPGFGTAKADQVS
jgi:hypothetical protein